MTNYPNGIDNNTSLPPVTPDTGPNAGPPGPPGPQGPPGPFGPASGDLSGTYPNPTVIKLQGRSISPTTPNDGYALIWVAANNDWEPKQTSAVFSPGGDLSGNSVTQNVINIHGASVPTAGSLITGNVLQVTGASSLSYGAVNLAGGSNHVTGVLPAGNQANQTVGGDLSGTTSSATVTKIQNHSISSISPIDGYVLTWVNSNNDWEPVALSVLSGINSIDISGSGDITLSLSQLNFIVIELTGSLTGDRTVIFPVENGKSRIINNKTSGNFITYLKMSGGSSILPINPKGTTWFYTNGTEIVYGGLSSRIYPPETGLVYWWPCKESSGTTLVNHGSSLSPNNDLAIQGGATLDFGSFLVGEGKVFRAYSSNNRYAFGPTGVTPGTSTFMMSVWAKFGNTSDGGTSNVLSGGNQSITSTSGIMSIHISTTTSGGITASMSPDATISNGEWHHILGGYNGTSAVIFVDGVRNSVPAASSSVAWSTDPWTIGGNSTGLYGLYEDVRVYNFFDITYAYKIWSRGMGLIGAP